MADLRGLHRLFAAFIVGMFWRKAWRVS